MLYPATILSLICLLVADLVALDWYYVLIPAAAVGIVFTTVVTSGVVSSVSTDTDGFDQISVLHTQRLPIQQITICFCPLPREHCCDWMVKSLVNMWVLVFRMLTLGQIGHLLNHHGVILRLDAKGNHKYAAIDHNMEGQRVQHFRTETEARGSLFEGYVETERNYSPLFEYSKHGGFQALANTDDPRGRAPELQRDHEHARNH